MMKLLNYVIYLALFLVLYVVFTEVNSGKINENTTLKVAYEDVEEESVETLDKIQNNIQLEMNKLMAKKN